MKKATRQQTKDHNVSLVLRLIFQHDSISRAEIARLTSLTRTTVSDIVADLLTEGLVEEVGMGSSIGGKSPILLSLVDDSRSLIGLDLAHNQFSGAVVNLRGQIKEQISLPVQQRNGDDALALVYEILDQLVQSAYKPLVGIGVGTPGWVNTQEGVVLSAVNLDWKNLPLGSLLQVRYQLPVSVLNDSQAAAVGEHTYGEGHKVDDNLIVINVRHGIGAGLVIGGQLYQGDEGGAGEIGHVVIVREGGLLCRCGNLGCLETVASAQAVVQRAQIAARLQPNSRLAESPEAITLETLESAFMDGDPVARQVILEAGRYLGLAIASLVGALNIRRIVLSGDMTRFGKPWLDVIQDTVCQASLLRLAQDTRIEIGRLGPNSIIQGASASLLNDYSLLFIG